jgi:hypothetical protein
LRHPQKNLAAGFGIPLKDCDPNNGELVPSFREDIVSTIVPRRKRGRPTASDRLLTPVFVPRPAFGNDHFRRFLYNQKNQRLSNQ